MHSKYPFPPDRGYDREHHMWARMDDSTGRVLVGIDALGLASLGELAYITLHDEGASVRRGESIGTLEAAKMTGDFLAPVSGILVARNANALGNPNSVNEDPYGNGWLVAINPENWDGDLAQLVSGDALPAFVDSEIERYRTEGWID